MFVEDRMTPNPVTVSSSSTVKRAMEIMQERNFTSLPVIDHGSLVGVITKDDIADQYVCDKMGCKYLQDTLVEEVMSKYIFTVKNDDYLETGVLLLREKHINSLPVLDDKGNLVGVLTRSDVFDAFLSSMGTSHKCTRINIIVPDFANSFRKVLAVIAEKFISLEAISIFETKIAGTKSMLLKVRERNVEKLLKDLEKAGAEIKNVNNF